MKATAKLRLPHALAFTVFLVSLVVYVKTAARFMYWGDSCELVAVAHTLGIAHPPGYPLYTLLGALVVRIPLGTPFFMMSLMSAVFGAAAAAAAALVIWFAGAALETNGSWLDRGAAPPGAVPGRPVARAGAALLGGFAVAFCPTVWSQATVPEVYSLSLFLLMTAMLLAVARLHTRRRSAVTEEREAGCEPETERRGSPGRPRAERPVVVLGLILGLSLAHHLTAVLVVPSVAVLLFAGGRRPQWRALVGGALLGALALTLYAYLPVRYARGPDVVWAPVGSWPQLVRHVTGAQYASRLFSMSPAGTLYKMRALVLGLGGEVPWSIPALAVVGGVALWVRSRVVAVSLFMWGALVVAHALAYGIPDVASYYIPAYAMLGVLGGIGLFAAVAALPRVRAGFAMTVGVAVVLVALGTAFVQVYENWGERDLSGRDGGRVYVNRMLEGVAAGGLVLTVADNIHFPLLYARHVENRRGDMEVLCIRDYASELDSRVKGVSLPGEGELCSAFEKTLDELDRPVRESVPVGNYLPLLVSMNEGTRPIYADPGLARQQFLDRATPSGILTLVSAGDSLVAASGRFNAALWPQLVSELGASDDAPTMEVYARTLAEHGMIHLARSELTDAIGALEMAAALAPWVPLCRNNLAVVYHGVGRYEEALRELEAALELDPGLAATRFNLFVVAGAMGDRERARRQLVDAVRLAPGNADYKIRLAALYESVGDYESAEAMFESASAVSPDYSKARLAHGEFLSRRKRYSEAVAAYGAAEGLEQGTPDALAGLGRCYWALDDRVRAVEVMRRLVELQPHNPAAKYELALMLHRSGRSREAVPLLDDVIRLLPGMWQARALKASILGELGRYLEARNLFEQAAELGARSDAFWETWGSMERAAGDTAREREVRARSSVPAAVAE
jgi:tetratricopeptide (TPR) repeat protein